ncbi:AAC(3) family N-acetyltransferase [Candidatus Pelagibacter sp.]|jgi:aminoglycoside 3-N-acetyltransferase|nr:AAC(3) family N-acetyltransferase [Candidatus Pelagibacter sp.]
MAEKFNYTISDIKDSINRLNINTGDNIYVSCNLANLGFPKIDSINLLPGFFFKNLKKKISKKGTIIVPTHSFFLKDSKKDFNLKSTPCESGAFSNHILKKKSSVRQMHPLASVTAIGKNSKLFCNKNGKNAYGLKSPFSRMIKANTKFISIGIKYNLNCTQIHHLEQINKVPYRFFKEFKQNIKVLNKTKQESFYMYVLKKKFLNYKRDRNKLIFANFRKFYKVQKVKLGADFIYLYDLTLFSQVTSELMRKNKYCWLGKKNASI